MIRPLSLAASLAAAVALSGCVSLFPKSPPATTYKLTATAPNAAPAPPRSGSPTILLGPMAFTRPSASDRILTTNGLEAAYIADARWIAPAPLMFQEALANAFDQQQAVNLTTRGEAVGSDFVLRVEMRTFEAQYAPGQPITSGGKKKKPPKLAAPTVAAEAHITLVNLKAKAEQSEITFRETALASDNRVGAIVNAYDEATTKLIGDIVGWTSKTALAAPKATTPESGSTTTTTTTTTLRR